MEVEKMIHDNSSGFGRMNGIVADKTGWFLLQDIYFFPTGAFKAIFFFLHIPHSRQEISQKKLHDRIFFAKILRSWQISSPPHRECRASASYIAVSGLPEQCSIFNFPTPSVHPDHLDHLDHPGHLTTKISNHPDQPDLVTHVILVNVVTPNSLFRDCIVY